MRGKVAERAPPMWLAHLRDCGGLAPTGQMLRSHGPAWRTILPKAVNLVDNVRRGQRGLKLSELE